MRSPDSLTEAELAEESVVHGGRLLLAFGIALGLCAAGLSVCFAVFLFTSTLRDAFHRTLDQAPWIIPSTLILFLPTALRFVERRHRLRSSEEKNA